MNYTKLLKADIANGPGFRLTLWVTGCSRRCPGCFNEEAQDPNFGQKFDNDVKKKIFKELGYDWCKGVSFLGGEPLSKLSDNRKQVIAFAKEVREKFPDKDQWLWSGYTLEEIQVDDSMKDILKYIDVLVDGPFIEEQKDLSIPFRGSRNQRILKRGIDF